MLYVNYSARIGLMPKSAHLKHTVLGIFFILASINFARTTFDILKSSKRLDDLKGEISGLEAKKTDLEADFEYKKSSAYVEKTARNDLSMVKPGEQVFVVVNKDKAANEGDGARVNQRNAVLAVETGRQESNPRKWWSLFF